MSLRDTDQVQAVPSGASITVQSNLDEDPIDISTDHLNMVKFASREDGVYEKVSEYLKQLAREAPDAVGARWAEQGTHHSGLNKFMALTTRTLLTSCKRAP